MRLSKNATPIREAVIVIKEDTTIAELLAASNECCRRFGIKPLQIYTHKDEGHLDKYNQWKPNFHAHIVFCWYNFNTHRTFKLNKYAMYDIQTIFADALSMERGKSSDMRHLNSVQYKIYKEEKRLKTLEYAIKVTEAEWEEKNQARKVEEGKLAAIAAKRQQIDKEANALKTSINLLRNIIAKTIEYLSQKGQYEDFLKEAEFNADEKKILSYIRDICNKGMTLM